MVVDNALQFKIQGMDCANCAKTIESAVARMEGVANAELNFTTETLRVSGSADAAAVTKVVTDLGYTVLDPQRESGIEAAAPQNFGSYMWARRDTRLVLLAALLLIPGVILNEIMGRELLWVDALAGVALLFAGWPIAHSAWKSLRYSREININVLMTIAAIGAVIIGAYVEAAMVMVLFAIGEALEGYTAGRARSAIRSLMQIAPPTATRISRPPGELLVLQPDLLQEIDVGELAVGDHLLIRPGERVPMDGRILSGVSAVDQAAITGESRLIEKEPGDEIFAGSINGEGVLEMEVTHLAEDNTISRMIKLVEEAQEKRAPAQRFVDQFARYYTPAVVLLALGVMLIPPLIFNQPFLNTANGTFGWFYRGLALLVVACPCALVISTPVSIISAISNGARHGILIKGGIYLESLSKVEAIAFDKTGTLTEGKPSVVAVRTAVCSYSPQTDRLACSDCEEVLALAGAVEQRSEHPLARAVEKANRELDLYDRYGKAENVTALTGRGVRGTVNGRDVVVGSHKWFDAHIAHPDQQCSLAVADERRGYTPLLVSAENAYLGTITVADQVRGNSAWVLNELKALGVRTLVMLTGDSQETAEKVGRQIGVTDVRSELLPADKVKAVRELQAANGAVAMVGDGINDAPALATADVGIAVGGAGKPSQAMETADITLMNDDIGRLPFTLDLSQATMRTIRANIAVSIAIKIIFLLLVLGGVGTMWMAVLADMGTSVLVTLNGMRLLNKEPSAS